MGPEMKKEGYDESFSAAVNITSATTGLTIPPSNILIIYSLASGGAIHYCTFPGRLSARYPDRCGNHAGGHVHDDPEKQRDDRDL